MPLGCFSCLIRSFGQSPNLTWGFLLTLTTTGNILYYIFVAIRFTIVFLSERVRGRNGISQAAVESL
jgi:hypothetical protein